MRSSMFPISSKMPRSTTSSSPQRKTKSSPVFRKAGHRVRRLRRPHLRRPHLCRLHLRRLQRRRRWHSPPPKRNRRPRWQLRRNPLNPTCWKERFGGVRYLAKARQLKDRFQRNHGKAAATEIEIATAIVGATATAVAETGDGTGGERLPRFPPLKRELSSRETRRPPAPTRLWKSYPEKVSASTGTGRSLPPRSQRPPSLRSRSVRPSVRKW